MQVLSQVYGALPGVLKFIAAAVFLVNIRSWPLVWHCESCSIRLLSVSLRFLYLLHTLPTFPPSSLLALPFLPSSLSHPSSLASPPCIPLLLSSSPAAPPIRAFLPPCVPSFTHSLPPFFRLSSFLISRSSHPSPPNATNAHKSPPQTTSSSAPSSTSASASTAPSSSPSSPHPRPLPLLPLPLSPPPHLPPHPPPPATRQTEMLNKQRQTEKEDS